MDICLVGAPGSGKTDLAFRLADKYEDYDIIDEYVEDVCDKTTLVAGIYGGYAINFLIAAERLQREMAHFKRDQPYIVCGSTVESITYYAMAGSSDPNGLEGFARLGTFMNMMGMLIMDFGRSYLNTFFLPLPEDHENYVISSELETALDTLNLPYDRLPTYEEMDEQVAQAVSKVEAAREQLEAAESERRGVRPSGGDGEAVGDPTDAVSDVQEQGS